jgi:hypothetical protein
MKTNASSEISKATAALGRVGGRSTSAAKKLASKANGKRGGRPRKIRRTDSRNDLRPVEID